MNGKRKSGQKGNQRKVKGRKKAKAAVRTLMNHAVAVAITVLVCSFLFEDFSASKAKEKILRSADFVELAITPSESTVSYGVIELTNGHLVAMHFSDTGRFGIPRDVNWPMNLVGDRARAWNHEIEWYDVKVERGDNSGGRHVFVLVPEAVLRPTGQSGVDITPFSGTLRTQIWNEGRLDDKEVIVSTARPLIDDIIDIRSDGLLLLPANSIVEISFDFLVNVLVGTLLFLVFIYFRLMVRKYLPG